MMWGVVIVLLAAVIALCGTILWRLGRGLDVPANDETIWGWRHGD